ncbi:MAG: endonuclease/exonuclease/phosphatase family protein, partial [Alphaproteobacteria bacterium]|nr:endonuclease/exonuclease/phosphatase family protein [Alphaproteobacteria bacterium]
MGFSFLSWNVRHYRGDRDRFQDVSQLISDLNPDVFGLLEFEVKFTRGGPDEAPQNNRADMRELMLHRFPEYDFAVTDSRQGVETIVGFRNGMFEQVIWTQRRSFAATDFLRPGALISLNDGTDFYSLLFLHTDSGVAKPDYDNRQAMFRKIWSLQTSLTGATPSNNPNLIVLGDLNTMGWRGKVTGRQEIDALTHDASQNGMRVLDKDRPETWHAWGKGPRGNRRKLRVDELAGAKRSNLDHVIASDGLEFANAGHG